MLRGTKKQIIHLKNPESPLFEEAFLIVKHDPSTRVGAKTLAEEANRLLTDPYKTEERPSPARHRRDLRPLLFGFLLGASFGILILVLCLLL